MILLHIPHSSLTIPREVRKELHITDTELSLELLRMTDWYTSELFELDSHQVPRLVYPYSRLVCDVERFPQDANESMAAMGMGAIYERTSDGRPLRDRLSGEARNAYLERYYYPHHRKLQELTGEILSNRSRCLIVDCHSFPTTPLLCDRDQSPNRPDICIGTDSVHTPPDLVRLIENACCEQGLSFTVDRPYSGTIVPQKYFKEDERVKSIMIEIRRGLYIDDSTGVKLASFDSTRAVIRGLLLCLLGIQ